MPNFCFMVEIYLSAIYFSLCFKKCCQKACKNYMITARLHLGSMLKVQQIIQINKFFHHLKSGPPLIEWSENTLFEKSKKFGS